MSTQFHRSPLSLALAVATLAGGALFAHQAAANTAADTTILNVVHVYYQDAGLSTSFEATASASVTVNLVESGLTVTTAIDQTVGSGATATYVYDLTATANGSDTYDVEIAKGATSGVINDAVTYSLLDNTGAAVGAPVAAGVTSVTLGASLITAVTAEDTLQFAGGTLSNISAGDVVVINGESFIVTSVVAGSGASHDNTGATAHTDIGVTTAEVAGVLVLQAHPAGSAVAPSFVSGSTSAVANVGDLVAERVSLAIYSTADTNTAADGTVVHTLESDYNSNGTINTSGDGYANTSNTTTFTGTQLSITKSVRNVTAGEVAYAATTTGDPTDVLEYEVIVENTGGGSAANVYVVDTVPTYTSLVVSGGNFGTITDGTTSVTLTDSNADSESQGASATDVGYGNATGSAAGDTITIYVGDGATNAAGGSVASGQVFTIKYQVTIE